MFQQNRPAIKDSGEFGEGQQCVEEQHEEEDAAFRKHAETSLGNLPEERADDYGLKEDTAPFSTQR